MNRNCAAVQSHTPAPTKNVGKPKSVILRERSESKDLRLFLSLSQLPFSLKLVYE